MRIGSRPIKVSQLTNLLKEDLEREYRDLWVEGEISNLRVSPSRHYYFTLKDPEAQIKAVFFRGKARFFLRHLKEGNQVVCHGDITLYRERGEIQIMLDFLEPRGLGEQLLSLALLKKRLEDEGLFQVERKRPLPALPKRVGIITSPHGAAIRDIIKVTKELYPQIHLLLYPVYVQGEKAPQEIRQAIEKLNKEDVDVIILSRGGGSQEDLHAFNTEQVARAVAASRLPLVSAVGHEIDVTLADLAADFRASTPSAAAHTVVAKALTLKEQLQGLKKALLKTSHILLGPSRIPLESLKIRLQGKNPLSLLNTQRLRLDHLSNRLLSTMNTQMEKKTNKLNLIESRLMAHPPTETSRILREKLTLLTHSMVRAEKQFPGEKRKAFNLSKERLETLSPLSILKRGYAILLTDQGRPVTDETQVEEGERLRGILHQGELLLTVRGKRGTGIQKSQEEKSEN
jgi:exodeoxyribonuclease VII large subunit